MKFRLNTFIVKTRMEVSREINISLVRVSRLEKGSLKTAEKIYLA